MSSKTGVGILVAVLTVVISSGKLDTRTMIIAVICAILPVLTAYFNIPAPTTQKFLESIVQNLKAVMNSDESPELKKLKYEHLIMLLCTEWDLENSKEGTTNVPHPVNQ